MLACCYLELPLALQTGENLEQANYHHSGGRTRAIKEEAAEQEGTALRGNGMSELGSISLVGSTGAREQLALTGSGSSFEKQV